MIQICGAQEEISDSDSQGSGGTLDSDSGGPGGKL
jgi:hypothetical protein